MLKLTNNFISKTFHTITSKINIKKRFPFKKNKIYVIYYEHPLAYDNAYINTADKLLSTWRGFNSFVDQWTIEYKNQIGTVKAILLYYGLPLRKKRSSNVRITNLEDLENSSDKRMYYKAGMYHILKDLVYLDDIKFNKILKLLGLTNLIDIRGKPINVKELEEKNLDIDPSIKLEILDFLILIQKIRAIGFGYHD